MDKTSRPPTPTMPWSGATNPAMTRRRVVLPDPDGPSSAQNEPSRTETFTSSRTVFVPYSLEILARSRWAIGFRSWLASRSDDATGAAARPLEECYESDRCQHEDSAERVDVRLVAVSHERVDVQGKRL